MAGAGNGGGMMGHDGWYVRVCIIRCGTDVPAPGATLPRPILSLRSSVTPTLLFCSPLQPSYLWPFPHIVRKPSISSGKSRHAGHFRNSLARCSRFAGTPLSPSSSRARLDEFGPGEG